MSVSVDYKIRANHSGLMDEALILSAVQRRKGKVSVNITAINDAGATTIIAVDANDILAAVHMVIKAAGSANE